jgi:hypothetical protein
MAAKASNMPRCSGSSRLSSTSFSSGLRQDRMNTVWPWPNSQPTVELAGRSPRMQYPLIQLGRLNSGCTATTPV